MHGRDDRVVSRRRFIERAAGRLVSAAAGLFRFSACGEAAETRIMKVSRPDNAETPTRHRSSMLLCCATGDRGHMQPERSPWNPGGFLWIGWDRVTVDVVTKE
jgi:hypothetical protein